MQGEVTHTFVDTGEQDPGYNRTAILGREASLDAPALERAFVAASREIPAGIADLVLATIRSR
jgi:hypothetical protein